MMNEALELARQNLPHTIALRRKIHDYPELGDDLPRTKAAVLNALAPLGLDVVESPTTSSFTATLKGGQPGKILLLRADMDALPMNEETGLDFSSTIAGRMHSCGHDCHTAMLVTAAHILHANRGQLHGDIKFMFQADEEGNGGARVMMDEGLLKAGGHPDAAFALHILPNLKAGIIATRAGTFTAAADSVNFRLQGAGGHGSAPHQANDPIPVACEIILALQVMVTRKFNVFDPVVVTVGFIHAGTLSNIIPVQAVFEATVRTCTAEARDKVHHLIGQIASQIAAAHEMTVEITPIMGSGPTINDVDFVELVESTVKRISGKDSYLPLTEPYMFADDFSDVLHQYGGAYAMLGVALNGTDPASAYPLHSTKMIVEEDALAQGVATHVGVAMAYLNRV